MNLLDRLNRPCCVCFVALSVFGTAGAESGLAAGAVLRPGEPIDYGALAFEPDRWKARHLDTRLIPWAGTNVVLLTTRSNLDLAVMGRFVGRVDGGWALYRELTGRSPEPFKLVDGKPCIAAVPGADLTCGYGCGFIGATGIEVGGFYDHDFRLVTERPRAFPHYYFYEMGRNYYTFGDRHSGFITGFAVFMRYVCMDTLGCEDEDADTRRAIEEAEARLARSELSFLQAFTLQGGLDEKAPRFEDLSPCDQPVLYASAMLRLHRDCGGNAWLKRFFAALGRCPEVKPDSPEGALQQGYHWMLAASLAARRDLSPLFADRWRLPLKPDTRRRLAGLSWEAPAASVADVLAHAPAEF